ncbi:hypothetical protein ACERZ8_01000 [Tateyamaria armeniaca]|uniref:Peptidase M10 metallopeptidase domain-containing protein n=1 Tax=Tateyamaria armeniaca TaxID=2518930 RepID=A0ABW8UNK2_9RHOB
MIGYTQKIFMAAAVALFSATIASAATVTLTFSGKVDSSSAFSLGVTTEIPTELQVGQVVSGRITYDTGNVAIQELGDTTEYRFPSSIINRFELNVGGWDVSGALEYADVTHEFEYAPGERRSALGFGDVIDEGPQIEEWKVRSSEVLFFDPQPNSPTPIVSSEDLPSKQGDVDFSYAIDTKNFGGGFIGATAGVGENTTDFLSISYSIDEASISFGEVVEPVEKSAKAAVFINPTIDAASAFVSRNCPGLVTSNTCISDVSNETFEIYLPNIEDLRTEVREIFYERSGVNVDVVIGDPDDVPHSYQSVLEVTFAPDSSVKQFGEAHDITNESESFGESVEYFVTWGIDRFDRRRDGEVTIFKDEMDLSIADLATTIAHEVGHGFGLPHIDDPSVPEVMDYVFDGDLERFSGVRSLVTCLGSSCDSAIDDPVRALAGFVNPQYHLRAHVLGESRNDLEAEGLTPGSYDLPGIFDYQTASINIQNALDSIVGLGQSTILGDYNFFAVDLLLGASLDGDPHLHRIDEFFVDGIFRFAMNDFSPFFVFGRSRFHPSFEFTIGNQINESIIGISTEDILSGTLGVFDTSNGKSSQFASISVKAGNVYRSTESGGYATVAPVPLSASISFLFLGAGALLFGGRRSGKRPIMQAVSCKRLGV